MLDDFFKSKWGAKIQEFLVRNSFLPKRYLISDDPVLCDTDLYLLVGIPNQPSIDHDQSKKILRQCLKEATLSQNFDFELSTLRRFEISTKDQFLLLHTRVFGDARKVDDHIKYLMEADKIATKSLEDVLDNLSIKYDKIIKQYIFYSQNLNEFRKAINSFFPKLVHYSLNDHIDLYTGDLIIAISNEDRQISTKLGRMMFDILEEIMQPRTDEKPSKTSLDRVLNKYENIVSIDRTVIKRRHKKYFYLSIFIHLLIILLFVSFVYSYSYLFLSDIPLTAAILLILASISGLSILIFMQLWNRQDVLYR